MANSSLTVASLDFDGLKQQFRQYLENQQQFSDYNFEGSNISVLLNLLSYNTYQNAFYLNMVAAESFLDSAQLRDSVVSHAKALNYLPRSYRSSTAYLDLTITPSTTVPSVEVPAFTEFTTKVDGTTYTFTTNEALVLRSSTTQFVASNVEIYEGKVINESFVVNTSNTDQRFIISSKEVDTSSMTVSVRASTTDSTNASYSQATSILGLTPTSNVYFVQAAENDCYELVFGDDVVGRALQNGNVIDVIYRISSGEEPNEANSFTLSAPIDGHSNVIISVLNPASGGAEQESVEDIKFYAPRNIAIQERTITSDDYLTLLKQNFPEIEAVNVFGGEELNPPRFGRVIVSVDLANSDGIPNIKKNEIISFLSERSPLGIEPEVIDPEFLYVTVDTAVSYNVNVTRQSRNDIATKVSSAIETFAQENINDFKKTFRFSRVLEAIDDSDASILGNETEILLYKLFVPTTLGSAETITLNYNNSLKQDVPLSSNTYVSASEPALTSTTFTYNNTSGCSFRDNGAGVIQIVVSSPSGISVIETNIGSIDYDGGTITLNGIAVDSYSGSGIKIFGRPQMNTVSSKQNIILTLDSSDIEVTVTQESV